MEYFTNLIARNTRNMMDDMITSLLKRVGVDCSQNYTDVLKQMEEKGLTLNKTEDIFGKEQTITLSLNGKPFLGYKGHTVVDYPKSTITIEYKPIVFDD